MTHDHAKLRVLWRETSNPVTLYDHCSLIIKIQYVCKIVRMFQYQRKPKLGGFLSLRPLCNGRVHVRGKNHEVS